MTKRTLDEIDAAKLIDYSMELSDLSKAMSKDDRPIPSGPFKGKRIELAPTETVDMFQSLAEEFMEAIFEMKPGSYLITDESSLRDFEGVGDMDLRAIRQRVHDAFGVDVSDIPSGNLADIFVRIHRQRYGSAE